MKHATHPRLLCKILLGLILHQKLTPDLSLALSVAAQNTRRDPFEETPFSIFHSSSDQFYSVPVSGRAIFPVRYNGPIALKKVTADGDQFTFVQIIPIPNGEMKLTFEGTVRGDHLQGVMSSKKLPKLPFKGVRKVTKD